MRDSGLSEVNQTEIVKLQMDIQKKKNLLPCREKDACSKSSRKHFKKSVKKMKKLELCWNLSKGKFLEG